jgi:hypothetical protein
VFSGYRIGSSRYSGANHVVPPVTVIFCGLRITHRMLLVVLSRVPDCQRLQRRRKLQQIAYFGDRKRGELIFVLAELTVPKANVMEQTLCKLSGRAGSLSDWSRHLGENSATLEPHGYPLSYALSPPEAFLLWEASEPGISALAPHFFFTFVKEWSASARASAGRYPPQPRAGWSASMPGTERLHLTAC